MMNIQSETEQETQQHIEKQHWKRMLLASGVINVFNFGILVLFVPIFILLIAMIFDYADGQIQNDFFLDFLIHSFNKNITQFKQQVFSNKRNIIVLMVFFVFIFCIGFFGMFSRLKEEYQLFSPNFHEVELNASDIGFLTYSREVLAGIDHMMAQLSAKNKKKEIEKFIQLKAFVSSAIDEAKNIQHDDVKSIFSSKRKAVAQFYTEGIHSEIIRSQATYLMHAFIMHLVMEYARLNKLISACKKKNYHVLFMLFMYQTTDILSLGDEEKKVVYSMIDFSQNRNSDIMNELIRKHIYKRIVSV